MNWFSEFLFGKGALKKAAGESDKKKVNKQDAGIDVAALAEQQSARLKLAEQNAVKGTAGTKRASDEDDNAAPRGYRWRQRHGQRYVGEL